MTGQYTDMFNVYHRTASEKIIRAAQNCDLKASFEAIDWAVKGLREADQDSQRALALGLMKAAGDVWLVCACAQALQDEGERNGTGTRTTQNV